MRLIPAARRRFTWTAFLFTLLLLIILATLLPESMNTAARRLQQFRSHLISTPTPLKQNQIVATANAHAVASAQNTHKIGSILSTTQARPVHSSATSNEMSDYKNEVDQAIKENFVMVFSKSYCPYCSNTKKLLKEETKDFSGSKTYKVIELDQRDDGGDIQAYLQSKSGQRTVPQIWINQKFIGGNSDLQELRGKKLDDLLKA